MLAKLRNKQENKVCIDCTNRNPNWCSVPYGVWLCIECAGAHRKLGTHLSFVRSSNLDVWSDEQTTLMKLGGNAKARAAFSKGGIQNLAHLPKYSSVVAKNYKSKLQEAAQLELSGKNISNISEDEDVDATESDEEVVEITKKTSKLSLDSDEEDEIQIRSMAKKTPSSVSIKNKPISKPSSSDEIKSSNITIGKNKPKPQKVDQSKWDDWGNDSNSEESDYESENDNQNSDWKNDWDAPKGRKSVKSPKTQTKKSNSFEIDSSNLNNDDSPSSIVSKYGYQARVNENNFTSSQKMEGYGSSNHFGSISNSKPSKMSKKGPSIESIQDITDLDDLKLYAQQRGKQLATVGKEYTDYLKEKGTEFASEFSTNVMNWWKDFQNQ